MRPWDYAVDLWSPMSAGAQAEMETILMGRGAEGWELVTAFPLADGFHLLTFKRPR
ncbi:MAG: DUF4177 domain-containing protein [Actinomycetota bacterium]|nr:DUF4177 domain-containing protein [Actinomycetota bacterium]